MTRTYVQLENIVNELQTRDHVDSAAIIRRDGVLMASNLPANFKEKDVFAMLSATILGAAWNISVEHALGSPSRIIVETKEGNIVISEAGKKALLVCFVKGEFQKSGFLDSLTNYEDKVKNIL
jgi:predicted regulator of Ras-like GTPase activity (Roadblock/LC7/MglB family)